MSKPLTLDELAPDTKDHLRVWLTSAECDLICECLQIGSSELSRHADYVRRKGYYAAYDVAHDATRKSEAARALALKIEAQK